METDNNGVAYNTGTVGVIEGVSFNNLPNTLISVAVPESDYERQTIQTAYGLTVLLVRLATNTRVSSAKGWVIFIISLVTL